MMLEIKCQAKLADPVADDPDPNLAVAEGLPCFRSIEIGFGLVKTGNVLGSLSGIEQGSCGCGSRSRRS